MVLLTEIHFAFCSLCIGCRAERPADTPPGLLTLGGRRPPNTSSLAPRPPGLCCCCCCRLAVDEILPRWSQRCGGAPDTVIVQELKTLWDPPPPLPPPPPPTPSCCCRRLLKITPAWMTAGEIKSEPSKDRGVGGGGGRGGGLADILSCQSPSSLESCSLMSKVTAGDRGCVASLCVCVYI